MEWEIPDGGVIFAAIPSLRAWVGKPTSDGMVFAQNQVSTFLAGLNSRSQRGPDGAAFLMVLEGELQRIQRSDTSDTVKTYRKYASDRLASPLLNKPAGGDDESGHLKAAAEALAALMPQVCSYSFEVPVVPDQFHVRGPAAVTIFPSTTNVTYPFVKHSLAMQLAARLTHALPQAHTDSAWSALADSLYARLGVSARITLAAAAHAGEADWISTLARVRPDGSLQDAVAPPRTTGAGDLAMEDVEKNLFSQCLAPSLVESALVEIFTATPDGVGVKRGLAADAATHLKKRRVVAQVAAYARTIGCGLDEVMVAPVPADLACRGRICAT